MTFRPSDDVLDEKLWDQQIFLDQNNLWDQENWQKSIFKSSEDISDDWMWGEQEFNQVMIDIPVEEIKSPDISELLKDVWEDSMESEIKSEVALDVDDAKNLENSENGQENLETKGEAVENAINMPDVFVEEKKDMDGQVQGDEKSLVQDENYMDSNQVTDAERSSIVSWMKWAINSNLDFLVDNNWFDIVKKYKKLNCLFFRWWFFTFSVIIGIALWVFLQIKVGSAENVEMVGETSIENRNNRIEEMPDKILLPLVESGVEIDVSIPYGGVYLSWTSFYSKSNLILYRWVVLPQLSVIDYDSENFISLEDFNEKKLTRMDVVNFMNSLITQRIFLMLWI